VIGRPVESTHPTVLVKFISMLIFVFIGEGFDMDFGK
jgi:hypothetical protein